MRTAAVIQARLASTRLPGKVLMDLAGKPMLQHVIERVKRAKLIDEVILAIPWGQENHDGLWLHFNDLCHVVAFDIPENDLVQRFYLAAVGAEMEYALISYAIPRLIGADLVVRVCGDNPCIEPSEIDHLVANAGAYGDFRLLINSESFYRNHDGFGGELYTIEMLEWMDRAIKEPEFREHPHKFWIRMQCADYCGKPYPIGFHLDVNTMEDYLKLKDIFEHFAPRNDFIVAEVIEYLNGKNHLEKRNLPAGE